MLNSGAILIGLKLPGLAEGLVFESAFVVSLSGERGCSGVGIVPQQLDSVCRD